MLALLLGQWLAVSPGPDGEGELARSHRVHDGRLRAFEALGEPAGAQVERCVGGQQGHRQERNRSGDAHCLPFW
ncbi:hypothetical protein WN72_27950 [Bradyrhizobium arachidis]|uniref:Uncharacterized protein n=1 Tax=Bradyrhizobium arachidis TaxID=858423 RepID=A0AAE7NQY4_9BRAD|nr:hypothetical protein WN72_27950 [Bradyrhizobium arachidis]